MTTQTQDLNETVSCQDITALTSSLQASKGMIIGSAVAAAVLGGVVSIGIAGVCDANASGKSRAVGLITSAVIAGTKASITNNLEWAFTTGVVVTQIVGHGIDRVNNQEETDDTL